MKVNIGKNTLGDSNKMALNLNEYGRSTHDLSFAWRSTMGVGVLTPFLAIPALPGDTFEIDLENKILTSPTIGPLFGSFKFQADVFTCPIRLYNAMLHNNALNIGLDMKKVKLPKYKTPYAPDEKEKRPLGNLAASSLANMLEYRDSTKLNGIKFLAYYDIFKNYYANKQESKFPVYSGVSSEETINITKTEVKKEGAYSDYFEYITFDKEINENILNNTKFKFFNQNGTFVEVKGTNLNGIILNGNKTWRSKNGTLQPNDLTINDLLLNKVEGGDVYIKTENPNAEVLTQADSIRKIELYDLEEIDNIRELILSKGKQEFEFGEGIKTGIKFLDEISGKKTQKEELGGLCLKTYQSDLFTNWVNTEWIDGDNGISKITAIDTSGGSFTLDTLNLSKKVYEMLNRIAISGGTYKDWIETVYTTDYYFRAETPVYEGGLSSEIEFEEIVSSSASNVDEYEPLGTLSGRGINTSKKGGKLIIKINEPCYIMGIASITPRVDYSEGNPFDNYWDTLDDVHKPQLDGIGFQDLVCSKLDGKASRIKSIGKQPAWIDYTTNYNKTFGDFAAGETMEYMVLNRVFNTEWNKDIKASSYIQPDLYNNIFATTGVQERNFWVQIGCRIEARRVMSARQIPNF